MFDQNHARKYAFVVVGIEGSEEQPIGVKELGHSCALSILNYLFNIIIIITNIYLSLK